MRRVNNELTSRLDATGLDYDVVDCDPALADTAAFCEAYGYSPAESANTLLVIGKSEPPVFAACVVLATTRLDVNKVVRKRLGVKKASFASGDDTVAMTGMQIGGVTPVGLPADLPLWVDARVMELDRVIIGGGGRDRKFHVPPAALTALGAEVVPDLARIVEDQDAKN